MYLFAKTSSLIGKSCAGERLGLQCLVGGYNRGLVYWSSSEYSGTKGNAWSQFFSVGLQLKNAKVLHFGVRAIRAFNNLPTKQSNNLLLKYSEGQAVVIMAQDSKRYDDESKSVKPPAVAAK